MSAAHGARDLEPVPAPTCAVPGSTIDLGEGEELVDRPEAQLRRLAFEAPAELGSLSLGSPASGLLFNPVPMPESPAWKVRDPLESYGTEETIAYLARAVETVAASFPGAPRLLIGDISRADGGRLNRHRSHQSGRDVDVGLYYRLGEATSFVAATARNLDVVLTWALLRAVVTETDVEHVFLDRSVQRLLYDHAVAIGENRSWLDDIFGRRQAKDALIQHVRRHQDHMHVRFFNPRAQECGRQAYPHLVGAGVVPARSLTHRVRTGETIGQLAARYGTSVAAIRAANRMSGNSLRAGRSYAIPVRRVVVDAEPVLVPPRRLPPAPPEPILADVEEWAGGGYPESTYRPLR